MQSLAADWLLARAKVKAKASMHDCRLCKHRLGVPTMYASGVMLRWGCLVLVHKQVQWIAVRVELPCVLWAWSPGGGVPIVGAVVCSYPRGVRG